MSEFIGTIELLGAQQRFCLMCHNSMITAYLHSDLTVDGLQEKLSASDHWTPELIEAFISGGPPEDMGVWDLGSLGEWYWACGYEPMLNFRPAGGNREQK